MKYFIKTFGCAANEADSERIAGIYKKRGYIKARSMKTADDVVINTCMIRESAENRVYGLVHNLYKEKLKGRDVKIILTGCMVGMAVRDKSGKVLNAIKARLKGVDEFLPIEEIGFDNAPLRTNSTHAWVPISNGCNNFCTFCVVPFTRGREVSRDFVEIISEVENLVKKGYKKVTLIGQNVNSYGADLILGEKNMHMIRDIDKKYFDKFENNPSLKNLNYNLEQNDHNFKYKGEIIKPVYVLHLGRKRIPTLFPALLTELAKIKGLMEIDFISSNPWDFSDELINVIKVNKNITRHIHLPLQSGSDNVLKRMNRWYKSGDYLELINKIRNNIKGVTISTDIIVGFPGETETEFLETRELIKKIGFSKAYIAIYSDRPMTAAHKVIPDDIPFVIKKKRWEELDEIINKTNLRNGTYK